MVVLVWEPNKRKLTRIELEPKPKIEIEKMAKQDRNERALNMISFSPCSILPSYFNLPPAGVDVNQKLEPYYIQILSKFTGLEDAYLFLSEFEVCNMIHFHNVHIDVVKLRFVPFALKDNANRLMYSLPANCISSWNNLSKVFL